MDNEQKKQLERQIEEIFRDKYAAGRDYAFSQQTEKETYYSDQYYNVLVHSMRANSNGCYLLELEETKGEKDECVFSIYHLDGLARTVLMSVPFEDKEGNGNKADAANIFRRFRDAKDIRAEIEKYEEEKV